MTTSDIRPFMHGRRGNAGPTAGLHFDEDLPGRIGDMGVVIVKITLHVGIGTFFLVKSAHAGRAGDAPGALPRVAGASLNNSERDKGRRRQGDRRGHEHGEDHGDSPGQGRTGAALPVTRTFSSIPAIGFRWLTPSSPISTSPRSTPLMLVCAFAGKESNREGLPGGYQAGIQVLQLRGCDVYCMSALTIAQADGQARLAVLHTGHGPVETPIFMPVGTQGTVKGILQRDLKEMGVRMVLANAYHLYLRPGDALIRDMGGIQRFAGWDGAVLTDSGGYQYLQSGGAA